MLAAAVTVIGRAAIAPVVLVDEGHRVVVAAVAVVDRAGGGERLADAHVLVVVGLVKAAVSPATRLPAVIVGTADALVVPS